MRKVVDLHVHTNHSDSTATPVEVVDLAHKKGFKAIGITDHDCIDGIKPSIERAMKYDLEIVPGIEMAAEFDNFEMHILGYFIDWKSDSFIKKLEKIRLSRVERIFQMCKKLKNKGIDIDPKRVLELSGPGAVGRLHLAIAIYNEGYISTVGEAFRKYIGNNASCYVKKFKLTPKEAIREVRSPTIRFLTKLMPKTATAIAQKRNDNRFNTNSRKKSLLKHFIKIRPNLKTEFETILSQN